MSVQTYVFISLGQILRNEILGSYSKFSVYLFKKPPNFSSAAVPCTGRLNTVKMVVLVSALKKIQTQIHTSSFGKDTYTRLVKRLKKGFKQSQKYSFEFTDNSVQVAHNKNKALNIMLKAFEYILVVISVKVTLLKHSS